MSRCGQATTLLVQVSTYPETNLETSAAIVSSPRGREVNRRLAWAVVCVGHLHEWVGRELDCVRPICTKPRLSPGKVQDMRTCA